MGGQQEQPQPQPQPQPQQRGAERQQRTKSRPLKKLPASCRGAPSSPPFDYLVPINVCLSPAAAIASPAQQPSVDEQPLVESISWALLHRLSGRVDSSQSVKCSGRANLDEPSACSLSQAIQQLESSLEGKSCVLVTCGPLHLRQHLYPIAKRLRAELSEQHFSQYVDLLKEFDRCTFAGQGNISGRQVARKAVAQPACACCSCCAPEEAGQRRAAACADEEAANCAPHVQQAQQQQQIGRGTRKRFEEILKFLSIDVEPAKCRRCSPADQNKQQQQQPNCPDCTLALAERQVEASCSIIARLLQEGHSFGRVERIKQRVELGLCETSAHDAEQRVVRARGLPWQASEQDIADFFTGLNIAKGGVGLCLSRQGRRNGEALIQFESREHRNLALSRHKHFMGNRYIEVYRASGEDFQSVAAGYNNKAEAFISKGAQFIVRMRGLPFTCSARQVVDFFASSENKSKPCEVFSSEEGVLFVRNQDEKPTGDAFVLFATDEHARRAIAKHHQNIGTRYVELFRSTVSELQQVLSISTNPNGDSQPELNSASQQRHGKQLSAVAASAAPASRQKQQTTTTAAAGDKMGHKMAGSKLPAAKSVTVVGRQSPQLENQSAFPALSDAPIVWQRPEAATYAQVAHSKQQQQQPPPPQPPQQPAISDKQSESNVEVVERAKEQEAAVDAAEASESVEIETSGRASVPIEEEEPCESVEVEVQNESLQQHAADADTQQELGAENDAAQLASTCERLTLSADGSGEASSASSDSHSSAVSSSSPAATPSAHSPISSMCPSSRNPHYKPTYQQHQAANHLSNGHNHQHHNHQNGTRRYQNNGHHYQGGRHSARYHASYVYQQQQQAAMMQVPSMHPALVYSQDLVQTSQAQYASHPQMAYATPSQQQQQAMAAAPYYPTPQSHLQQQQQHYSNSLQQQQQQQQHDQQAAYGQAVATDPALTSRRDCIRLRGLPFEAQIDDVLNFLGKHSENIYFHGVHMVYSAQGQPTGEAIIQMSSCQAATATAQEAHRRVMSVGKKQRYIEVIPSSIDDMKPTLGYGLAALAASRAAAHYHMHPMQYAYTTNCGNHMAPMEHAGYPPAMMQQLPPPYQQGPADFCPLANQADQMASAVAATASDSSVASETLAPHSPDIDSEGSSRQSSDSELSLKEPVEAAAPATATVDNTAASGLAETVEPTSGRIREKTTVPSGGLPVGAYTSPSPADSGLDATQAVATTATTPSSNGANDCQDQRQQQQQQQQAIVAAAQAAAYYPILYYYPPPQQMLATAAPAANRYH